MKELQQKINDLEVELYLRVEIAYYKAFYEAMRAACPVPYIAYQESELAQKFACNAIAAIRQMQNKKELKLDTYVVRLSSLQYLEYFLEDEICADHREGDYECTEEISDAAFFYTIAEAQQAVKRLKDGSGIIAEIEKL